MCLCNYGRRITREVMDKEQLTLLLRELNNNWCLRDKIVIASYV